MEDIWGKFNRAHGVILDPYNRVGVIRPMHDNAWGASITRAVINRPAGKIIDTSFNAMFDIDYEDYKVTHLWHATIDELSYDMFVVKLAPGATFEIPNRNKLRFLPISRVMDEILDDDRLYNDDSIRVFTHLYPYITDDGIGTYSFEEVV